MPMEVMDYSQILVTECKYLLFIALQYEHLFPLTACLCFMFIPVHWLAVEEVRVELSVFRHVHLLLDQVPRLKQRVELEVKQGRMVRNYYVVFA